MLEITPDDESRKIAIGVLTTMFLEERQAGRHQEVQRATISTIIVTLITATLALIGVLWSKPSHNSPVVLSLTGTITLLGAFGYLITTKLFERSMIHYALSEAYRQTIEAIAAPHLHTHLPVGGDAVRKLPYVHGSVGKIGFEVVGRKFNQEGAKFCVLTTLHDALDPRPVVVPLHNENARFFLFRRYPFATIRLYALWSCLFLAMSCIGLVLGVAAVVMGSSDRCDSAPSRAVVAPRHTNLGLLIDGISVRHWDARRSWAGEPPTVAGARLVRGHPLSHCYG